MWLHLVRVYLSSLSTFALCAEGVLLIMLIWMVCGWIDRRVTALSRRGWRLAKPVPVQPLSSMARAIRREDRRPLSERLRADVAQRRDPVDAAGFRRVLEYAQTAARAESADRPQSPAHGALSAESCYRTTSLTVPKDAA